MKINCCIVDDEPLALDLLERYVEKTDFLELKGKCSSAVEAIKVLNKSKIDSQHSQTVYQTAHRKNSSADTELAQ